MLRVSCTKLVLRNEDMKEYENIRKTWDEFKSDESKSQDIQEQSNKVQRQTRINSRIGYNANK